MSSLLETVIDAHAHAHGGLDRWNQLDAVSAHLVKGGALWTIKGQEGVLADVFVRANLHQERESHHPFGAPDRRSAYSPQRVAIETTSGDVIEALDWTRHRESDADEEDGTDGKGKPAGAVLGPEGRPGTSPSAPGLRPWRWATSSATASWTLSRETATAP